MIFKTSDLVAVFSLLFIFLNIALFYHVLVKTIQQYKDYVNFGCNYVDGGMGAGGGGGGVFHLLFLLSSKSALWCIHTVQGKLLCHKNELN